ncbi:B12-binding domain-containing radical SAM protein [Geothrix rubra]|uniref:B12-binding domain-containing radical SAM protein n=1 Tax=Geothrix rubra TaxID=2927977 RepID=A0ABQ5Q7T0_9BACT|nr:radical SAM protein [Geothrix rubra]GLH70160.1 B12-binding domain-containing radical SAM protein [Geothrix rubra]
MTPPRTLLAYSAPRSGFGDEWMTFLPIGLGYLQAMLKSRGLPCRVANLSGKTRKEVLAYFRDQAPQVVGISMFTFNRKRSYELLAWAREACPDAVLLAGGPHPTHLAEEVFEDCPALDAIVKGEGEPILLGVVERLRTAPGSDLWKRTPGLILRGGATLPQAPLEDLDAIGIPAEHLEADFLDDVGQLAYLSTSRGCPATCNFCNTPEFWGTSIRFRSAPSVLREMARLRETRGLTYFSFRDDTFTANRGRVLELMEGIQQSGLHPLWNCQSRVNLVDEDRLVAMKRAGCEFMQFGVEHGSERVLALLDKGTNMRHVRNALSLVRKVGMNLGIYLITGIPGETWEDVEQTAALIRDTRPQDCQISPLALYPGTRMFDQYRAEGRIRKDFYRASGDAEIFARVDAHTEKALRHLDQAAQRAKAKSRFSPAEFAEQKRWLGFCAVTNLLCGEAAEEEGRWTEAEAEYAEIVAREPGNPWGFMKRALLREKLGRLAEARTDLGEVLALAPGNPEATELAALWGMKQPKARRKGPAHGPTAEMKGAEAYLSRPKM